MNNIPPNCEREAIRKNSDPLWVDFLTTQTKGYRGTEVEQSTGSIYEIDLGLAYLYGLGKKQLDRLAATVQN